MDFDHVFVKTLGVDWRQHFDKFPDFETWKRGCQKRMWRAVVVFWLCLPRILDRQMPNLLWNLPAVHENTNRICRVRFLVIVSG